jgi:hypothetical protein
VRTIGLDYASGDTLFIVDNVDSSVLTYVGTCPRN